MSALQAERQQKQRPIRIAPSILAGDPGNLRGAVEVCVKGRADQVHLDVIDGHFAPNITFGPGTIKALRKATKLKFDAHLMISQPRLYVDRFLDAGSDLLTFHAEVLDMATFDVIYALVHSRGRQMGLALKPFTELPKWAEDRLDRLSTILVLTVNPGFSGQAMDISVLPKLERIRRLVDERGLPIDIEVDGGVELQNVQEVVRRGANVVVAGAGVFGAPDPVEAITALRQKAQTTVATETKEVR